VNDRVSQVQTEVTGLNGKHDTDVSIVTEHLNGTDNKIQQAAAMAEQANANAAQASASAARADASAAQASASAARSEATSALADASAARDASAASASRSQTSGAERADRSASPTKLPKTGSPLPLIGLSGLFSLGAAGALRLRRR
jgi:LPXTG-motif cell wall-anchored protein